jgi:hypothetical protein
MREVNPRQDDEVKESKEQHYDRALADDPAFLGNARTFACADSARSSPSSSAAVG